MSNFKGPLAAQSVDSVDALSYKIKASIAMTHAGDSAQAIAVDGQMMIGRNHSITPFLFNYEHGRIALALGDIDKSLKLLDDATRKGMPFSSGYFDEDIFLAPLLREHRFERLTEAKD